MIGKRMYDFLSKIGFVRTGGSSEELKAAQLILDEIKTIGGNGYLQEFEVNTQKIDKVQLEILESNNQEAFLIEASGYGCSGSTSKDGLIAPFYYFEGIDEVSKSNAKGRIVLVNGYLNYNLYKAIVEAGAVGFITYNGNVIDSKDNCDLDIRELRNQLAEMGKIPGVNIRAQDAMNLVKSNPKTIKMTLIQDEGLCKSQNVIVDIPGLKTDNIITITAHYDSVPFSTGVYDNGAGSVLIMELYRYFTKNPIKHTLRFIWCGSEERGLLGSKAYIGSINEEDINRHLFSINVDVGGTVLGRDMAMITGSMELVNIINYLAKEVGFSIEVKQDIYSSDCIPFADKGIPAVSFARFGGPGAAFIHNRHDTMHFISSASLVNTYNFLEIFCNRIFNCEVFPVPREIPDVIKEKVNEYLKKKKA